MLIQATKPLFPWDELKVSPTLATITDALRAIPTRTCSTHFDNGRKECKNDDGKVSKVVEWFPAATQEVSCGQSTDHFASRGQGDAVGAADPGPCQAVPFGGMFQIIAPCPTALTADCSTP